MPPKKPRFVSTDVEDALVKVDVMVKPVETFVFPTLPDHPIESWACPWCDPSLRRMPPIALDKPCSECGAVLVITAERVVAQRPAP